MKTMLCLFLIGVVTLMIPAFSHAQEYMGSQFCRSCHGGEDPIGGSQYDGWKHTIHSRTIQVPSDSSVIPLSYFVSGDSVNMGPSFGNAKVYLSKVDSEFFIQVGTGGVKYKALMTTGWGYRQRYITKIDSSFFLLPIQFNPIKYMDHSAGTWVNYFPEYWFQSDGTPISTNSNSFRKRAWDKNCVRCHSTATHVNPTAAGSDTSWKTTWGYYGTTNYYSVGCEMCHGPFQGTAGVGMLPKLGNLPTKEAKIAVCGQCHSRGTSFRGIGLVGNHDFYKNELTNTYFNPVDTLHPLAEFANFCTPRNSSTIRGFWTWPDLFTSRQSPQQYLEYQLSDHFTTTAMEIVCWTCHDSHPESHRQYNIVDSLTVEGTSYRVRVEDNTLCLACHAGRGPYAAMKKEWIADPETYKDSIGALVTQHNHHPYDPTNTGNTGGAGQCIKCHMAMTAIFQNPYDQNSHTIRVVPPSRTLQYAGVTSPTKGMLSSCAVSCHRNPAGPTANVQSFGVGVDPTITDWTQPTDLALAESLWTHWQEWGMGHPTFSIQPNGMNFGNIVLGYNRIDSISVYNSGSTTFNITNVSCDRSEFVVTPTSASIAPGGSQRFFITFTPLADGHLVGLLAFDHDQSGSPEVVALAGSGVLFQSTYNVIDRWNLLSAPYTVVDPRKEIMFPTAISSAFQYRPDSGYVQSDTLQGGIGYWMKFDSAATLTMSGIPHAWRSVALADGWNLVGSLATPLLVSQLITSPPSLLHSDCFEFENGYLLTDTLKPMKGHWVKASAPGTLYLSAWGYPLLAPPAKVNVDNVWKSNRANLSTLIITDAEGKTQTLYFAKKSDVPSMANRDLPPKPPAGVFDVRYNDDRFIETDEVGLSSRFSVEISGATYPLNVKWEMRQSPVQASLWIDDRIHSLESNGEVDVLNPQSHILLELKGPASIPEKFALDQNYPNPFNPLTIINYQLPIVSFVTLKVFDVLGREVATLVNGVEQPGYKSVQWNASGMASGVYFYRLTAGAFTASGRMLLIR